MCREVAGSESTAAVTDVSGIQRRVYSSFIIPGTGAGKTFTALSPPEARACEAMYQALYRKYRPQTFDDVVGQEHITSTLKRQVQTGRLSHAYLFSGTRGTGKTTCARILARAVNCEHPVDGNPCNQCAACRGILDESILDVVELDAASHNGVDDVRALRDEAIFSPASVKKRVYIIDEAHSLASSSMAFNALLKILEEPPEHVMFILCTTAPQKILPTIVSRCQRHSFTRIEPDAIASRLLHVAEREQMDLTADAAALLARMADGGMRDALSLLDQCSAAEHIDEQAVLSAMGMAGSRRTAELLRAIAAGDTERALRVFAQLWQDGKEPAGILDELAGLMRDVLLLQVAPRGGEALLSGSYDTGTLRRFAGDIPGARLMDGMRAIRRADTGGADPRRAAEMCLVELCVPETGDSIQGLKNRVARLEAALKNGILAAAPPVEAAGPEHEPEIKAEPRPAAAPEPEKEIIPEEDAPPWYTDADAPPADVTATDSEIERMFSPAQDSAPVPAPAEKSAPAPATRSGSDPAQDGDGIWEKLIGGLRGKMDMGDYAMLCSPTQASGSLAGDTLTVRFSTPIAKMMLGTPAVMALMQEQLHAITDRQIRVNFTEGAAEPQAVRPDMERLDALSRFGNIKFE